MSEEKPLTREDVLKLIAEHGGPEGLDLSLRNLEGIDLSTHLGEPQFDLHGIRLEVANLVRTDLMRANLRGADLVGTNLQEARLQYAKLQGDDLTGATLSKAQLNGAYISRDTILEDVNWGAKYILGDEEVKGFQVAAEVYRNLKQWHTQAGMYDIAGRFYYREMEARRKAGSWKREPGSKLWSWAMRLLCGYGEKAINVVATAAIIIFGLAAAYYFLGKFDTETFLNSLYYSVVSFTAVGYGSWAPKPEGWAKAMGAAEAVIGIFIMALFLVTFTRNMTR